jgi:GNAT superfamily N-acetyltransferase
MRTRPIRPGEIDLFLDAASQPDHREETRQYLQSMFAAGSMRPEWCFVIQEGDGRPLGRVAFWTLPGTEKPFALVLLEVPWEGYHAGVGARLLGDVLDEARRLGADRIEHVLDTPPMRPQFQHHPEKRLEVLEGAGFAFRRETDRFHWLGEEAPPVPDRLSFRTLDEVGEDAFVDAMMRVSEGTLDREIREERERLGPLGAARDFFEDARRVKHDPLWWRLAYDGPDGDLAGLVMPAEPPGFLTLFYVGVVPGMRGRGYVDDLLAAGTAALLGAHAQSGGEKPLRADTDVANAPMAAAFGRAGWTRFAGRREYVVDLAPALGDDARPGGYSPVPG